MPLPPLFFFFGDNPFFWVRAGVLRGPAAAARGFCVETAFDGRYPGGYVFPVFNRFSYGRLYRVLLGVVKRSDLPYLADIDDLYWELPTYSADRAACDAAYLGYLDHLYGNAEVITCSTEYLRERLAVRFPTVKTVLVENAAPAWIAPPGALVIANTDNIKIGAAELAWFAPLLRRCWDDGIGIQLLGENRALSTPELECRAHSLPRLEYLDYHTHLSTHRFRAGLVPVEQSPYADAKSPIKILEFINHGIPVVASDTEPHRRFVAAHPGCDVTLVENTAAAWSAALARYTGAMSAEERERGRRVNTVLCDTQVRQLGQWEDAVAALPDVPDLSARTRSLTWVLRTHRVVERMKKIVQG